MRLPRGKALAATTLGAGGIVLATAGVAFPAVSTTSPPTYLSAGSHGKLVAKGAAIDVPVLISCDKASAYSTVLTLVVSERVGKNIAKGSTQIQSPVPCEDIPIKITVRIMPDLKAFTAGVGAVTAQFTESTRFGQITLTDQGTVKLK